MWNIPRKTKKHLHINISHCLPVCKIQVLVVILRCYIHYILLGHLVLLSLHHLFSYIFESPSDAWEQVFGVCLYFFLSRLVSRLVSKSHIFLKGFSDSINFDLLPVQSVVASLVCQKIVLVCITEHLRDTREYRL